MSHEQSETIQTPDGQWVNVYGRATEQAGQPLPLRYDFEQPAYADLTSAELAAILRSRAHGDEEAFTSQVPQRNR